VLLLHRRMPAAQVIAGIHAALEAGSCSPDVVAIEARKHHRNRYLSSLVSDGMGAMGLMTFRGREPRRSRMVTTWLR
jgi:hypothetical protein